MIVSASYNFVEPMPVSNRYGDILLKTVTADFRLNTVGLQ